MVINGLKKLRVTTTNVNKQFYELLFIVYLSSELYLVSRLELHHGKLTNTRVGVKMYFTCEDTLLWEFANFSLSL